MKRIIDIIISLIVIILFFPVGLLISLVLLISGEGEVFYKQSRVGIHGKQFNMIKFVTMVKDSPNLGAGNITLKEDPRILPFGKILRKTKLNEFPQFINVLLGQMSIVGPRPLVKKQYDMIPDLYKDKISLNKPGITGIGSIIFRDEEQYLESNAVDANDFYKNEIVPFKALLECWYSDKSSVFIDLVLILLTAIMVIVPSNNFYKFFLSDLPKHKNFNP